LATTTPTADASRESEDATVKQGSAKSAAEVGTLGRLSRGNTDIHTGSSKEAANDLPRIDPARFVGRVAKAFQTAQERGGKLQLRLSPPELGAMRIELTVKDGVMSAALETENAAARRVLLEHLPALRERLAEQNIRVERFDVDVRRENGNGQPDPRSLNQHSQQRSPDRPEPQRHGPAHQHRERGLPQPVITAPQISSTGINLVV
jgi:flagellar hook-length control protein FliK